MIEKICLILLVTLGLSSCEIINNINHPSFVGVNEEYDDKSVTYHSVNPVKSNFDQISTLTDITEVVQGVFTYDNINDYFRALEVAPAVIGLGLCIDVYLNLPFTPVL